MSAEGLVHAVSQIAEGLDLPVVLDRLVAAARDTTGARYAAIGVLGPDGLHEEFRHVGLAPDEVARMGELPRGHGVLGLITRERRAVVTPDIASHPASVGFPPGHPPMGSFLGVPLRVRGQVFGNLYLTDKPGGFDDDDLSAVESLAAAAAVAVDNARLYRAARDREAWAEAAGQVTSALLGGTDEEDALRVMVAHARRVADADVAVVAFPGTDGVLAAEVVDGGLDGRDLRGLGITALRSLGHTATCPLTDGDGEPGLLVVVRADGRRRFDPDEVAGVHGLAAQTSLSLRMAAQRRRGDSRVLLDERARIARDLHDLAVQQLFAVGIELGRVRDDLPAGELVSRVDAALRGLDTAVDHIRATLRPLRAGPRPATVSAQVARAVGEAAEVLGFVPELEDASQDLDSEAWDPLLVHDLLAALTESLANVARHSGAGWARVHLGVAPGARAGEAGTVHLVVEDDGVGVPADPARTSGLDNLVQRARQHGGSFTVRPRPDGGTRVEWTARP